VRVHLAGEHALEFKGLDFRGERFDVGRDSNGGAFIALGSGQLQQLFGATQTIGEAADAVDDLVKLRAFLAELLRTLRVVPNVGIFEFAAYFFEAFALGVVVKDTPVTTRRGWSGRRCGRQSDWFRSWSWRLVQSAGL
jgi:hypothetical protein